MQSHGNKLNNLALKRNTFLQFYVLNDEYFILFYVIFGFFLYVKINSIHDTYLYMQMN